MGSFGQGPENYIVATKAKNATRCPSYMLNTVASYTAHPIHMGSTGVI